jgi:NADH:ubiquinone oxidoreductase subunit 2 (subunit N)
MMVMAGGIDLITIFISLETMAVSFYILATSSSRISARTKRP